MSDTLTTLLKGLAEALAPHLPGGEDIDVSDAVTDHIDSNYDFADMVSDAVGEIDFEDILSDAGAITTDNFDATDFDLVSESDYSFDEFVTSEDVRDMVTEELQQTGAVVTRDNILSVFIAALGSPASRENAA
jgi:hypothetical protein